MYLLFDVGASKTRLALVKDTARLISSYRVVATPKKFSRALLLFASESNRLGRYGLSAVAGGVPGPLDRKREKILQAPNLPGWRGALVQRGLSRIFKTPVFIENDTALVGLGEAVYGAGKGYSIVAYVTVSTGVNGVRIVKGKIDANNQGFEIGHQIIGRAGTGRLLTLEKQVSGSALQKRHRKYPGDIHDAKVWRQVEKHLAVGLTNTILHWSPDAVILGGGVIAGGKISFSRLRVEVGKLLTIFAQIPPILPAKLGDAGGLHGALAFLKQSLRSSRHDRI